MSASWLRILALMITSSWLFVGCSGAKKIDVGGACVLNSDCNSSLVCSGGKCHDACHTSADCPAGQSCIIASDQSTVCQLPVETHCLYADDCPTPLICAVDQRCHNQCRTDVDCPSGQTCTTTKTCAEPSQVDSNNNLFAPDGGIAGCPVGTETCPCYGNDTCNTGLTCASHLCVSLGTGGAGGGSGGSGGDAGVPDALSSRLDAHPDAPTGGMDGGGGGISGGGGTTSVGGSVSCVPVGPEVCDGSTDENCNGFIDENCPCPGTGGPAMIRLPQGYCIDSTEVTRAQYAAWLATNPTLPVSTDANCGWKTTAVGGSYAADSTCMADSSVCKTGCDQHPQVCVDWCDAYAYCAAVGKRLCGKIGGGALLYADYANPSLSQWYNACTSGGVYAYPYGSSYNGQACNGLDYAGTYWTTVAVGTLSTCQSPDGSYAGVYDLSGNLKEWVDSCNGTGPSARCQMLGGAFGDVSGMLTCGSDHGGGVRDRDQYGLGFRCCSP